VADASLEESFTVTPAVGALLVSVTVPVEVTPPNTDVGFSVNDASVATSIVSVAVLVRPDKVA
jgi:hypothetical protein